MMSKNIRHGIEIIPPQMATGRVSEIYNQINHDLMNVPEPFTVHSPAPDILAGAWSIFRETLVAGNLDRGLKETVAVTTSEINRCPWCVDSHTISLFATGHAELVHALRKRKEHYLDPQLKDLRSWAAATLNPGAEVLKRPPFASQESAEIIGTAVTFHYLNRVVNATLVESPLPRPSWLHSPLQRTLGWLFRSRVRHPAPAGETLGFLPRARLTEDLSWAEGSEAIAGAFAGFATVIERAGKRSFPAEVLELAKDRIHAWNGEDKGLSRNWVEEEICGLPMGMQPVARLILLAGLASHQIDDKVIEEFRKFNRCDEPLIEALAWGSFSAARRIGAWLSSTHKENSDKDRFDHRDAACSISIAAGGFRGAAQPNSPISLQFTVQ